jgi:putative transposase
MSRIVIPGLPHHVTQRGVRSIAIFRDDEDRELYLSLLCAQAKRWGLRFEGWCLMTNHVHLVVIPEKADALARGLGEAHRLYTRARNFREGVRGYLFQGRFGSCVLDDPHLVRAVRYVEMNPVRARMVERPEQYRWSSARFHLGRATSDPLKTRKMAVTMMGDWRAYLREGAENDAAELERQVSTGRPWASDSFVRRLERLTGRRLTPRKGGWPKGVRRKGN